MMCTLALTQYKTENKYFLLYYYVSPFILVLNLQSLSFEILFGNHSS
jgi:hypothetical protein